MLPFIEISFRSSPIRGLGLSPFDLIRGGKSMYLPIDMMTLKKFDEENQNPQDDIKELRNNIDIISYITFMKKKKINKS